MHIAASPIKDSLLPIFFLVFNVNVFNKSQKFFEDKPSLHESAY